MVMILAVAVPLRATHGFQIEVARNIESDIILAEPSTSSLTLPAIAQHPSASQLDVIGHTFSEPLLLLLMGTLLIAVGTSIRRLTTSRRGTRAAMSRQT